MNDVWDARPRSGSRLESDNGWLIRSQECFMRSGHFIRVQILTQFANFSNCHLLGFSEPIRTVIRTRHF